MTQNEFIQRLNRIESQRGGNLSVYRLNKGLGTELIYEKKDAVDDLLTKDIVVGLKNEKEFYMDSNNEKLKDKKVYLYYYQ